MPIFGTEGIGMDVGSMQTAIFLNSEGEVALREPTSVLVNAENMQEVLAVGQEARSLLGRTARDLELISPVQLGAVADVELTALLMVALAEKATGRKKPMDKTTLVTGLSGGATKVERAALFQAMNATGAKRVAALRTPVAAAIGADLDISKPRGTLIVSLGGGYTEIAVLSMNSIVALRKIFFGGQDLDEAIVRWFWREKQVVIGMRTAEQLKREVGTVCAEDAGEDEEPVLLKGKNALSGAPASVQVSSRDIMRALEEPVQRIVDALRNALYNTPPELSVDIRDRGIFLTGGGALLHGLDRRLAKETGLPVRMSRHPQDDTAIGLGAAAANDRLLSALIRSSAAEASGE